jgi:RHS repeat-associated protein
MKRNIIYLLLCCPLHIIAQSNNQNYVMTETMLNADGSSKVLSVQYCDGLGRQNVLATNGLSTSGSTAYTLLEYEYPNFVISSWLPGVEGSSLDWKSPNSIKVLSKSTNNDEAPYTTTERDVLDREVSVHIPGKKWHASQRDVSTTRYTNVTSGNAAYIVKRYTISASGAIIESGVWDDSTLGIETVSDEDNKAIMVFTDVYGQKILERKPVGNGVYYDTYFVYNDYGQLRFVLTPAYNEISPSKTIFAYEYRYDNRGRMVMKILPKDSSGGSVSQYYYDRADRMAYMKGPELGGRYRFYLYDKLGRLCVQGTCSGGNQNDTILATATYNSSTDGICKTGYVSPYTINNPQLEIVNYYDNYDYIGKGLSSAMPTVSVNNNQKKYSMGYLTGQIVYASNGAALGSINVYDQKGQVVRSVRKGLNGLLEDISNVYSFTGAIDNTVSDVNVGYGSHFVARTNFAYQNGKKTKMELSVSHGQNVSTRETAYAYDSLGKLNRKERQLIGNSKSVCSYTYDLHGWLTNINSGGFHEKLYYADGLDGGCYNGNISTIKWQTADNNTIHGYNLKYDSSNRLYNAVYGNDDNLTSCKNYFNEYVQYDSNGNITRLQRRGLTDNIHGGFGLVDDLYMSYDGNLLTSVRDNATHSVYAGATDFYTDSSQKEYPVTYNGAGSLLSDAGRKIAKIEYDQNNNPIRIQFTNGNVIKYIYSATGEKLRVTYQTAVPNINVAIGSTKELASSEILSTDYVDYLLGGSLTMKNGRIDKYQFDEGYCQAKKNVSNTSYDDFTFCYYDQDHLGNIRQVTEADGSSTGSVIQKMNYYPFGAQLCDGSTDSNVQSHKFNGKEFDKMHGLNTYDYGARQYNPITARWDRVDPLCEKYYHLSPYSYCGGDPINRVDLHGDSITILDMASIDAIYNALQPGTNLSMKFKNGVLIPESIRQIALNSPDAFLQDLYSIATNPQMVELATTSTNDYYIGNQFFSNPWSSPSDIDYAKEFNNGQESLLYPLGKTIIGNLGQTLYPISSDEYKRSTNNNVRININAMGNINQRSCGIAHEFGHVILFFKGQPHSHSNNADYIYGRQWNVMRRLGYDYLESPTGTVFR